MRCPKCQKKNPPDQKVYCYFCKALLEPGENDEILPERRADRIPLILIFIFMIVVLLTVFRRGF